LPRVFAGLTGVRRAVDLDAHFSLHGPAPRGGPDLIDLVERSGLRGRGGAGFPTGRKLAAVAHVRKPSLVVVNAAEGEPTSGKDRSLVRYVPHLVLDGAVLAAQALGVREVVVAIGGASEVELAALSTAIGARTRRGLDSRVALRVAAVPDTFLAGEETALVRWIRGGPAKPSFGVKPFESGILVQNAETLAHLALIARFGDGWFRELGTQDEPGSALVTLTGAVARAGVLEVALGTTISSLLKQAGGASERITAVLVGGYFGSWLDASALDTPLLDAELAAHGASLGARAIVALPDGACGVFETARVARYLANEGAGQCGPCINGLESISRGFWELAHGQRDRTTDLRRWIELVRGRGACKHPDGAARFVKSALSCFADEIELHLRGRCSGNGRAVLPVPRSDPR
jgi:NADH:ubiquinone oxidoreductase subunit F (NADH-binding)